MLDAVAIALLESDDDGEDDAKSVRPGRSTKRGWGMEFRSSMNEFMLFVLLFVVIAVIGRRIVRVLRIVDGDTK